MKEILTRLINHENLDEKESKENNVASFKMSDV